MIESLYILLITFAFIFLPIGFFMGRDDEQPKFLQQVILFSLSAILFGASAAASANVEFVVCTSAPVACSTDSVIFEENMYIFGFFTLIASILALIKSFDAFFFAKAKL